MNKRPRLEWLKEKLSKLKNKQVEKSCESCGGIFKISVTHADKRKNCSIKCKAKGQLGSIPWNKGIVWERMRGENSPCWKGGTKRQERHTLMGRIEYKTWRISVFKRDDYKCVKCGCGGFLHANHIKSWSEFPELRFSVENGETLCVPCHFLLTFNKNISPECKWGII